MPEGTAWRLTRDNRTDSWICNSLGPLVTSETLTELAANARNGQKRADFNDPDLGRAMRGKGGTERSWGRVVAWTCHLRVRNAPYTCSSAEVQRYMFKNLSNMYGLYGPSMCSFLLGFKIDELQSGVTPSVLVFFGPCPQRL